MLGCVREVAQVLRNHRQAGELVRVRGAEAEHLHRADVVPVVVVRELAVHADRVAGHDARRVDDLGMGVAGVDADGVQLEQFAAVVLVQGVDGAVVVVQVRQHRRALRAGEQQVAERAQRVLADDVAVVDRLQIPDVAVGTS